MQIRSHRAVDTLIRSQRVFREQASHHVGTLHIAAFEVHQHLVAYHRLEEGTASIGSHRCCHADPRGGDIYEFLLVNDNSGFK